MSAIAMLRPLTLAFTTALCGPVGSMLNALDMRRITASPLARSPNGDYLPTTIELGISVIVLDQSLLCAR